MERGSRRRNQIHEVFGNFAGATTLHGVPKVIQARSSVVRLIWVAVCLVAFLMFGMQVYKVLDRYFSYPKKVTVDVSSSAVPFPSITMCNMRFLDSFILNTINRKFIESHYPVHHLNSTESEFVRHYMMIDAKYDIKRYHPEFNDKFRGAYSRTTYSANIPQHINSAAGIQLEEFIVSCYFKENKCNYIKDFLQFFDPHYFNCFTYNGGHLIDGVLSGGAENGWSSVVFSGSGMLDENDEIRFFPGLSDTGKQFCAKDGVRVVIHPPGTTPFPMFEGFDVPPGFSASFGVRPRKIKRIKNPHGNCTETNPFYKDKNETFTDEENSYRLISCQKMCLQSYIIDSCGCKAIELPDIPDIDVFSCQFITDFPDTCLQNSSEECLQHFLNHTGNLNCMYRIIDNVTEDSSLIDNCSCFPPCDEIQYDVSYSLSKWPAAGFLGDESLFDILYTEQFGKRFNKSRAYNMTASYLSYYNKQRMIEDFARISVYIADTNMIVTQELEDYTGIQMVSDIGGQLGLWVGISIITLAEVIELVCDLCWLTAFKKHRNPNPDQMSMKKGEQGAPSTDYSKYGCDNQDVATLETHVATLVTQIKSMEERLSLLERGSTKESGNRPRF